MQADLQSGSCRVLFFESHPVQYKAPVYQALQTLLPDAFAVIYATDVSVRAGNIDQGFGSEVVWDIPLMNGYQNRVLNNERGVPFTSAGSLSGRGVFRLLRRERPRAIVLTHFRYRFDQAAYISALMLGIPILIRQETQDEMHTGGRPWWKALLRSVAYRCLYWPCAHAFAFGVLNFRHLRRHGFPEGRITFARFSVPNACAALSFTEKQALRQSQRQQLNIADDKVAVCFFGKFIPKKSPALVFAALGHIPEAVRKTVCLVFVGSGELQAQLQQLAQEALATFGITTAFTGFVNQSRLPAHYLAADIAVLPSSYEETWGLVVNEALNAGCGVVVTKAVGCQHEFAQLPRVRVVATGNARELAAGITELCGFERDFDWAEEAMRPYSSEAAAQGIASGLKKLLGRHPG